MKERKYALVMSGGGFKGAFQLGALNYLAEHWNEIEPEDGPMHFDLIAGVSAGALNGVMVAMNKLQELNDLWLEVGRKGVEEIYNSPFIDTKANSETPKFKFNAEVFKQYFLPDFKVKASLWDGARMLFSKKAQKQFIEKTMAEAANSIGKAIANFRSIADNKPLYEKLKSIVNRDEIKDCRYFCGYVSLDDGAYTALAHDQYVSNDDFVNAILASTAIPTVWEPVADINTSRARIHNSVDGGIRNNAPLGDVIQAINEENCTEETYTIVIINCNTGTVEPKNFSKSNIFEIALRSLEEISLAEIFNNDIHHYLRINDLVCQAKEQGITLKRPARSALNGGTCELRSFRTLLIQPGEGVLGDMLCTTETLNQRRISHGYQKAKEAVEAFVREEAPV